ncbi:unnamed protein product [Dimorphilus gyrociliatus]|uniref:Uncharacterized protein n=1 Tax=Dimorphilus gyrociliatus TaxID=2664684 RepID=A0A7I8VYB8_9ANNE|nr:unnamed protein product [Dimorphilus gyrociliatus]
MRFLFLLLSILLAKVDYSLSTCPKPCVCIRRRAFCDQTQIKAMPSNLPKYLTYINLAKNYLRRLNWRRMRRLSNLKHIVADSNKIFTLDNRIFKACPNLTSLSIADNRLAKIMDNDTFSGLGRLRALNMADNRLTDLKAVLRDLENLLYFSAAGNRLTSLSSEEFVGNPNLKGN